MGMTFEPLNDAAREYDAEQEALKERRPIHDRPALIDLIAYRIRNAQPDPSIWEEYLRDKEWILDGGDQW